MAFINDEKRSLLHRILDACLEINSLGCDSFFSFSGHVNDIDVMVSNGTWSEDNEPLVRFNSIPLARNSRHYSGGAIIETSPEEELKALAFRLEDLKGEI